MGWLCNLVLSSCLLLPGVASAASDSVQVDNFDGDENLTATAWWSGCDKNNLGTTLAPDPFKPTDGGSPASPKRFARIAGHYGKNAAPYPWASLQLDLDAAQKPLDLSAFKAIRFMAKGKGTAKVLLVRDAVKDYAEFEFVFPLTDKWTKVEIPFADFKQPSTWGNKVPRSFTDVKQIKFVPDQNDADYDIGVDDLSLVRDPSSTAKLPFAAASSVPQLPLKDLLAKKIAYTTLSLGPDAKWAFKDDVAEDGKGGWTDQGKNSVYDMPTGKQVFEGIPFTISADPKAQAIVLRGQGKAAFPTFAEVKVGAKGKAVYFLHAAAWASGIVGTYTVEYADGKSEKIDVRANIEVFDWWSAGQSKVTRVGWAGKNPEHSPIGLTLFAWENPRPDVAIAKIKAETTGKDSFFMIAGMTVASDGPYLTEPSFKRYDTKGWFPWEGYDLAKRKGTALDMSKLLDAPAGKHGFVKKPDTESFVFDDGTEARFFGMNVVAANNFPTHAEAEKTAELLAQMGVNITRHHHMDADWADRNIFGKKDNTLALDADSLDRFDYLVSQLQKRGIYQYLDLIVNRKPFDKDGIDGAADVSVGYKMYGTFVPKLIQLQKLYAKQLLTHKNPYTGKTYGEDPAVVMQEIINEDSPFYRNAGPEWEIKGKYIEMWNQQWSAWLLKNIGDQKKLSERWSPGPSEKGKQGLSANEDPKAGNVFCIDNWLREDAYSKYSRQRVLDTFYYYYALNQWFYREMTTWIRQFRPKGLITGSNHWFTQPIDAYLNVTETDYLDRHEYWAHPSGGWAIGPNIKFDSSSMTKSNAGGIVGSLTGRRVKGRPMIVTEWNAAAPNDYRQEALFMMGAASAFQNWSAIEFDIGTPSEKPILLTEPFNSTTPKMLAAWPAAALMYHRQDVARAKDAAFFPVSDADVMSPKGAPKVPDGIAFAVESGIEFTGKQKKEATLGKVFAKYLKGTKVTSSTGELTFDPKPGIVRVDTPRSQGFTGFAKGQKQTFANVEATLDNDYGMLAVSSLENKPIAESSRLLVSAVGNVVNTGFTLSQDGGTVKTAGELPVLIEPLTGLFTVKNLKGDIAKLEVWALDASGQKKTKVEAKLGKGTVSFRLDGRFKAQSYEIVR